MKWNFTHQKSMQEFNNMGEILSQEEFKIFFLNGDEYIKTEYYINYISQRLLDEFEMKYNEKKSCWSSGWSDNQRFVVELYSPKGNHKIMRWGYNYSFIPDINRQKKLVWYRTDSSIKIHIDDAWYNHIEHNRDQEWGYSEREFYNPVQCPDFQYEIPVYTSDMDFALDYIKSVIDKNILLMRKWVEKVKTIDDAIEVMNQRVLGNDILHIPRMHYIRAFLYAKNKNILDSMFALKQYYEEREIPQIIIDKLNQIAGE